MRKRIRSRVLCASVAAALMLLSGCNGNRAGGDERSQENSMLRIAKKARKTGNPDAAISFYNKVLEINPDNPEGYLGLAETYIDTSLLDAAVEYIKKAENSGCDKNRSQYLRGKILLLSGDVEGAEERFLKSKSIDAINALGTIYDEREDHSKAQNMYKQVISRDPNYIDAYNNLGLSLLLCEKYKEAIFYLQNACALPEANVAYRSNLALAYALCGDIGKARAVYAQDFEAEELEEKVVYAEDLYASKQNGKGSRQNLNDR